PKDDAIAREAWLKDNSFNTDTYEEIFSLPQSTPGGKKYYAVTFGDIRLVVLYVTNFWGKPNLDASIRGRYAEAEQDLNNPEKWGYGQHIFEPIARGSEQYNWLEEELNSQEFKQAKYKVVMLHHPPHTLGGNIVPAYTDPMQIIERHADGSIKAVRYEYPKQDDYIIRDVEPLLESAGVQLVLFGHSHLWNRFISPSGMHFLETSNVGNSFGADVGDRKRPVPIGYKEEYVETGDPNGLEPVLPTIAPLIDEDGKPLPYVASNDITVFSILDTGTGTVSSYRFDTAEASEVVKFDEFKLR
ncbi:MAG TPA: metallophosphoesterase, partial [Candidatus Obscuribacterales bacterium]